MQAVNVIDIDIISLLVLVFIYINTIKRAEQSFTQHKLFIMLIGIMAFLLVFDGISRVADGQPGPEAFYVNWASNMLLYVGGPLVPGIWALYADYQVFHSPDRLNKYALPLWACFFANTLLALGSTYTGWFFTVGSGNLFHRGPLFWLYLLICYALLLYTFAFIVANRKRIDKKHYAAMLLFILPPTVGGILQSLFYGLSTLLSSITLSALMLFFNTQDQRIDTDYLTGVFNRRLLDSCLKERIGAGSRRKAFSAILVDLDGFKEINDTYGHIAGDNALMDAVKVLRCSLRDTDFIARYGGDEFLAVLDIGREDVLVEAVRRIRDNCEKFNQQANRPYRLSFSIGYSVCGRGSAADAAGFLRQVDKLMYEDKKRAGGPKQASGSRIGALQCP